MSPPNAGSASLCTTPACIHIASEILLGMDTNYGQIDPCTDFDQYVCGNWASRNPVPASRDATGILQVMADRTYDTVRQILESPYPIGPDAGWITVDLTDDQVTADKENFAKVQTAYATCMNHTAQEEEGLHNLQRLVKIIVDIFPATPDSASDSEYETLGESQDYSAAMGKTLTLFETLGIESIQRMVVKQHIFDPTESHLLILPGTPSIPEKEEEIPEWQSIVIDLLSAVHPANLTVEKVTALVQAVSVLEGTIAQARMVAVTEESEALQKAGANPLALTAPRTSLTEIQKALPQLNYEYVIGKLAPEGYTADKVALVGAAYYKNISDTISRMPAEAVQTFFIWKALAALSPYVKAKETNALFDFNQRREGKDLENPTPRTKTCALFVDEGIDWISEESSGYVGLTGLTWIISRFFIDKTIPAQAKDMTLDLVRSLKDAFVERLGERDWLSDEVKKAATKKVKDMMDVLWVPTDPDVVDPIAIRKYYSEAEISSSHFSNALSMAKVNIGHRWAQLGKPFNKAHFQYSTLSSNALYTHQTNVMELFAGIQQFPLFDVDFPSYLIYGGLGSIVGHEITHGFDQTGSNFDSTGNLTTWYDHDSLENFTSKTKCFIEQYGNFTVTAPDGTEVPVSGELTLAENIADAGGVASSYTAWQNWERKNGKGKTKSLPGLDGLTHEQLFFVRWGQTCCSNVPPAEAIDRLTSDKHSPGDARIKLTLENSEGFKKAFNCPKKEPVCEIW